MLFRLLVEYATLAINQKNLDSNCVTATKIKEQFEVRNQILLFTPLEII